MARKTSIFHLFNTTHFPTAAEAGTVRKIIADSNDELSKLRNQVTVLRNKLSKLLAKCDLVEERIKVHGALLAPIRRLPQEILSEIFLHCLPVYPDHFLRVPFKDAPCSFARFACIGGKSHDAHVASGPP
ncbi:hypothetical protein BD410DRAFT_152799 [Rickenella mellea]|uniref:F-box domain-containing protein n=1 Tax=Rickenella mellea TaxID=50990 RepID=A0A4Y7QAE7_9AGAM|nr:hypothetical protein BD410DRAFT_152799 [Rickenella mellea]